MNFALKTRPRQGIARASTNWRRLLAQIAARVQERPDIQPGTGGYPAEGGGEGEEGEEAEGIVDLLAKGEEALPKLGPLLGYASEVVKSVGQSLEQATKHVQESDAKGRGFAGRLTVSRQLAKELSEPAEKLAKLGEDYAALLVDVDPAILTIIRMVEAKPSQYEDSEDVRELFGSIKEMVGVVREAAANTEELVASMEVTAGLSRDLRRPIRRMQTGLRGFADGRAVFEEWDRLDRQVRGGATSARARHLDLAEPWEPAITSE